MGFAAGPAAGMACVLVGFVLHVEGDRRKRGVKLLSNAVAGIHDVRIRLSWLRVNVREHAALNSAKSRLEGFRAAPA
jgi:hypothetical protein